MGWDGAGMGEGAVWPWVVGVAFAVWVVMRGREWLGGGRRRGELKAVYRRREGLLSDGELAFYRVLVEAAGAGAVVMVKVRLGDLVMVPRGVEGEVTLRNRVQQKHVDFVVCGAGDVRPQVVVELDDRSHQSEAARRRDAVKDAALAAAGLPLVRVKAARRYAVAEVRRRLGEAE